MSAEPQSTTPVPEHCTWAQTEVGRPECPNEREVKIILHGRYVAALCAEHTAEIVPMLVKKYKTVQTWPYKEKADAKRP